MKNYAPTDPFLLREMLKYGATNQNQNQKLLVLLIKVYTHFSNLSSAYFITRYKLVFYIKRNYFVLLRKFFIASKLFSDIICSILQASAEAIS